MSLSSVLRSPAKVVSSRAAVLRTIPYFASAGPSAIATPPTGSTKSLTTLPLSSSPLQPPDLPAIWFNSAFPQFSGDVPPLGHNRKNPDAERKVKLGKTLQTLQERLPTLLQSPLPQEILSPNISLHLFPTTHPYLPAVSGRVAYIAALWTSPIAWNRVPIVGNVKLCILSERMTTSPLHFSPRQAGAYGEQLVVKWRTAGKSDSPQPSLTEQGEQRLDAHLRGTLSRDDKKEFTGLFIFEFDKDGKIISHTIEHVDQSGEWEKGVGAKVVGLTDWLLGNLKGGGGPAVPTFQVLDDRKAGRLR